MHDAEELAGFTWMNHEDDLGTQDVKGLPQFIAGE
jgi:hypothetical protein